MDARFDSMEQKLGNIETKLQQIRQMVLEQQSRPPVTVQKKGNSHIPVQRLTLFDPILILLKPLVPMLWQKEVPPEGT
ncbi:hypothetical protein A2U01_0088325, partial [Trifolium medium]|nr:hypothetical protein [Trifolium medium]